MLYPGSLLAALLELRNVGLILENLAITFTLGMCTVKLAFTWSNMQGLKKCKSISDKMDEKARKNPEEFAILLNLKKKVRFLMAPYLFLYTVGCTSVLLSLFFYGGRRLIYPAYFPFNWKTNNVIYGAVLVYQGIGCVLQDYSNMVSDTFLPLVMCILTHHQKVLSLRISKIGTNKNKCKEDNHNDLRLAIRDHKEIME